MQKSLYKNTIFKTTLNIFNIIIPILIGPYVMRVLDPKQIGSLNFAQSIFSYFFIFAGFGVAQYGVREISRVREDKKKLEQVFTNLFLVTFISNTVSVFLYYVFIYNKVSGDDVYFICQLFTLYFIFNIFQIEWMNIALENFKFITLKTIVIKIIYVAAIFIFVKSAADFNTYVFLIISTNCIGHIISFIYIKKSLKFNFEKIELKKHIKPMFLMVIISNANVLYTQLDRYMIGEFINVSILSYYAIAQGIMNIINTLLLSIIQACIPRLNSYLGSKDNVKYVDLLYKASGGYFMLLFPASLGMILLSEELIVLYGGNQYAGTGVVLASFGIYMLTVGFDNILGNQIMYVNRCEKKQIQYIFIGGIFNLILNLLLVKFNILTPSSAILTTMMCNIVVILLQHIYIKKVLKLDYNIFSFKNMKYLIISLVFIPIIFVIKIFNMRIILEVGLSVTISIITYFSILYIIKDEMFNMLYDKIKFMFLKKIKK